jgi:hypothetical protein
MKYHQLKKSHKTNLLMTPTCPVNYKSQLNPLPIFRQWLYMLFFVHCFIFLCGTCGAAIGRRAGLVL